MQPNARAPQSELFSARLSELLEPRASAVRAGRPDRLVTVRRGDRRVLRR
jgi:hypothetical protein